MFQISIKMRSDVSLRAIGLVVCLLIVTPTSRAMATTGPGAEATTDLSQNGSSLNKIVGKSEPSRSDIEAPPSHRLRIDKSTPSSALPFWKTRPELSKRIRDQRAVIVSVKSDKLKSGTVRFHMQGAGMVARSKDHCFRVAQQYHRLKDVSDHFRTVSYFPPRQQLHLVTEALGYQARMILQMTPVSKDWRSELQFEILWGHFKGMKGFIGFERAGLKQTEISLEALYEANDLPLPLSLMGFALEVITQKVAERMRSFLENNSGKL